MIWLTKFHSDWQKLKLFSTYFSFWTDTIFKIKENDRQVWKLFNISSPTATLGTCQAVKKKRIAIGCSGITTEIRWVINIYRRISVFAKKIKWMESSCIQWWFVYPDTFVPGRYFRINKFSGLLNRPLVWTWKSVPTLFVRTNEISGLSEPGLTNHHWIWMH